MKIEHKMIGQEHTLSLQEIYCNTVLETQEGNQLSICMRDDTIEMSVVGSDKWFRVDMQTGKISEQYVKKTELTKYRETGQHS